MNHVWINILNLIMSVFPVKLIPVFLVPVLITVVNVQEIYKLILKEISVWNVQTLTVIFVQTLIPVLLVLKDFNLI